MRLRRSLPAVALLTAHERPRERSKSARMSTAHAGHIPWLTSPAWAGAQTLAPMEQSHQAQRTAMSEAPSPSDSVQRGILARWGADNCLVLVVFML